MKYRVHGLWLDGGEFFTVWFTRKRDAKSALKRFQEVALLDCGSLVIEAERK